MPHDFNWYMFGVILFAGVTLTIGYSIYYAIKKIIQIDQEEQHREA
jgi:hypothetical protein